MAKLRKLLGASIYELRSKANFTQAQFAEMANVSNDTISRIERGVRSPSFLEHKCPLELVDLLNYFEDKKPDEIEMILKI